MSRKNGEDRSVCRNGEFNAQCDRIIRRFGPSPPPRRPQPPRLLPRMPKRTVQLKPTPTKRKKRDDDDDDEDEDDLWALSGDEEERGHGLVPPETYAVELPVVNPVPRRTDAGSQTVLRIPPDLDVDVDELLDHFKRCRRPPEPVPPDSDYDGDGDEGESEPEQVAAEDENAIQGFTDDESDENGGNVVYQSRVFDGHSRKRRAATPPHVAGTLQDRNRKTQKLAEEKKKKKEKRQQHQQNYQDKECELQMIKPQKKKLPYSRADDKVIITELLKGDNADNLKGVRVWSNFEDKSLLPGRTWQSMKNRFLTTIRRDIDTYGLLEEEKLRLMFK